MMRIKTTYFSSLAFVVVYFVVVVLWNKMHLTSPQFLYASLYSRTYGCNWFYTICIGIVVIGDLHLNPSKPFPLEKNVEECADGCFFFIFPEKNKEAILL